MQKTIWTLSALSTLACAIGLMAGVVLAYTGVILVGAKDEGHHVAASGGVIAVVSAVLGVTSWWLSRRLRMRHRFGAALVAAAPLLLMVSSPLAILASVRRTEPPLPTTYARPKVSRPLWQACAYPLAMQSHLNVERLTSLISSGKADGADLAQALKDRGCLYESVADDRAAIADYSKALAIDPNDAEIFFLRGRTLENEHEDSKALADFDAALRLMPTDSETYYRRGHLFADALHDDAKAVTDYGTSIRLDPGNPSAYSMRAIAYENLGRTVEAAADRETTRRLAKSAAGSIAAKRAAGEWE